jgi:hypothetical protein
MMICECQGRGDGGGGAWEEHRVERGSSDDDKRKRGCQIQEEGISYSV